MNLTDQFLLAMPGLYGSYFGGSLIYLCQHDTEGALGLVVNQPGERSLRALLEHLSLEAGPDCPDDPVYEGGPVSPERGFILHTREVETAETLPVSEALALSASTDLLAAIAAGKGPSRYLVALGYAGWGAGQLEAEIQDNAWLTGPAATAVLFDTPPADRLGAAAQLMGFDIRLLAGQAGHG